MGGEATLVVELIGGGRTGQKARTQSSSVAAKGVFDYRGGKNCQRVLGPRKANRKKKAHIVSKKTGLGNWWAKEGEILLYSSRPRL